MKVLIILSLFCTCYGAENLKLAILMFRHGDRSAISPIPNDIYNISSWPQGSGQLSKIGMENHLKNGLFFRDRYMNSTKPTFLDIDPNYKRDQVYVRSTDKDRTLMSAQSMLSSIFPPQSAQNLTSPLDVWQPIPVHTVKLSTEPMLDGLPHTQCANLWQSLKRTVEKNPGFNAFMEKNENISREIANITGLKYQDDQWAMFNTFCYVQDTLFCEMSHNFSIKPEFVKQDLYDKVKPFSNQFWKLYTDVFTTQELAISAGVLFRELKMRINNAINETDDKKLILFSGHDTTLAAILSVMGVFDGVQTPYATVLMLELWETEDGNHEVRLHRHHKDDDLITYQLPGCNKTGCNVAQFNSLNKELERTAEQFYDQCKTSVDFIPGITKNILFILLCVTLLLLLSTMAMFGVFHFKRSKSELRYDQDSHERLLASVEPSD